MDKHDDKPARRVLLVEDEPAVRLELRELLEEEGYEVIEAANGKEAIAALEGGAAPSIVVLDLMMPVMDGWEFLEKLDRRGAHMPVVLATAAEPDQLPRGIPKLRKPFAVEPLLNLLQERCRPRG